MGCTNESCVSHPLTDVAWQEMASAFYSSTRGKSALEAAAAPYEGSQRQTDSLVTTQ